MSPPEHVGRRLPLLATAELKQKSAPATTGSALRLSLRETGSELTPSPLRLPSKPICDSSHVFVHKRDVMRRPGHDRRDFN
jgi:hypothetical protein